MWIKKCGILLASGLLLCLRTGCAWLFKTTINNNNNGQNSGIHRSRSFWAHFQAGSTRTDGQVTMLDGMERIFVLSDLHCDHKDNMKWLKSKVESSDFTKRDLVVCAGDISHDMEVLCHVLETLVKKTNVIFVPGNHEAWIDRRRKPHSTSLEKLQDVYEACDQLGVYTKSLLLQNNNENNSTGCPLWILPLESWYDGTLSFNGELCKDFEKWPWVDFHRCAWPDHPPGPSGTPQARLPMGLAEDFLKKNEPILQNNPFACPPFADGPDQTNLGIMTVSHFLPNKYCLPDWKDVSNPYFRDDWLDHGAPGMSAKFALVAGSSLLDDQIRELIPAHEKSVNKRLIHVFGHSHRPKDFEFKRVRYIHNPLGKPRERQMYMVSPDVDFQLVWDTRTGEVPGKQVLRLWEEQGGGLEALQKRLKEVRPKSRYHKDLKATSASGRNSTSVQTQDRS